MNDADGGKDGDIAHDAAIAHFLVPGVEDRYLNSPSGRLRQASNSSSSILGRRKAVDTEFAHHGFHVAGGG